MRISLLDIVVSLLYVLLTVSLTLFVIEFVTPYLAFKRDTGFLALKQQYYPYLIWRICFYIHVFSAFLLLACGLTQFSSNFLDAYPQWHRRIGKFYAWELFLINVPTGMVLSVTAIGPWLAKVGFVVLDCLWFWYTYKAIVAIKQKNVMLHKHFMMRSYALTFSAITLRIINVITMNYLHWDPIIVYTTVAWMGWLPNLLFVEMLIRREINRRLSLNKL
jgi:hypothetical protein